MGWLSDVFKFETGHLDDIWGDIKDNPERILVGATDPASTKAWNKVLGKDWDPMVDQMGGATKQRYTDAEAKGINTGPARGLQDVAHVVAAAYAGNYGANQLGAAGQVPASELGTVPSSAPSANYGGLGETYGPSSGSSLGQWGSGLQKAGNLMQGLGGQQQQPAPPRPIDTSSQSATVQQMIQQLAQQRRGRS